MSRLAPGPVGDVVPGARVAPARPGDGPGRIGRLDFADLLADPGPVERAPDPRAPVGLAKALAAAVAAPALPAPHDLAVLLSLARARLAEDPALAGARLDGAALVALDEEMRKLGLILEARGGPLAT